MNCVDVWSLKKAERERERERDSFVFRLQAHLKSGERNRGTERETDRQTERQRETKTERQRQTERDLQGDNPFCRVSAQY